MVPHAAHEDDEHKETLMIKSLIAAAALTATTAGAVDMKMDVDTAGNKVAVHVTIHNTTSKPIWVPIAIADDKELFGKWFKVLNNGKEVEYQGITVKRGPLTGADFMRINAGKTHRNTIDVTHAYAWGEGVHTVSFDGVYLTNIKKIDDTTPLKSSTTFRR
jgi:hypothetical protein